MIKQRPDECDTADEKLIEVRDGKRIGPGSGKDSSAVPATLLFHLKRSTTTSSTFRLLLGALHDDLPTFPPYKDLAR